MARLEGKRALITGAASGIGAACALRFAEEGAAVAGLDIQQPADPTWQRATELALTSHFVVADVSNEAQVSGAIAAARDALGGLDILVNAAGIAGGGPAHMVQEGDWDRVLDVNLKGTWLVSKHVLPTMLESGGGSIVHIASVEGLEGFEGGSAYNASKGGVVLLTKNMAIDYGRRGIRVNAVCPGFIETPLLESVLGDPAMAIYRDRIRDAHQLGRLGKPEEIAQAALFLASDEASFVTGVALPVDGGFTAGHRVGLTELMGLA